MGAQYPVTLSVNLESSVVADSEYSNFVAASRSGQERVGLKSFGCSRQAGVRFHRPDSQRCGELGTCTDLTLVTSVGGL